MTTAEERAIDAVLALDDRAQGQLLAEDVTREDVREIVRAALSGAGVTLRLGGWARVTTGPHEGMVGQLERGPWPNGSWTVVPVAGRLEHILGDHLEAVPNPKKRRPHNENEGEQA